MYLCHKSCDDFPNKVTVSYSLKNEFSQFCQFDQNERWLEEGRNSHALRLMTNFVIKQKNGTNHFSNNHLHFFWFSFSVIKGNFEIFHVQRICFHRCSRMPGLWFHDVSPRNQHLRPTPVGLSFTTKKWNLGQDCHKLFTTWRFERIIQRSQSEKTPTNRSMVQGKS